MVSTPFGTLGHSDASGKEFCKSFIGKFGKMANLDRLPRRTDVPVVCFPVTIEGASAGWVRPVAMFEPGTLPEDGDSLAADGGHPVAGGNGGGAA
jgi:hypothetical protein